MSLTWIGTQLLKKTTPNYTFEKCREYLGLDESEKLDLEKQTLVIIGVLCNGQKEICFLRILAVDDSSAPFRGAHYISVFSASENMWHNMWVPSLCYFRKHICKFKDRGSFERTTFVVLQNIQKLIRVKKLRSCIKIPVQKASFKCSCKTYTEISIRTQRQTESILETLYTSYCRDLHTLPLPEMQEVFKTAVLQSVMKIISA